MAMAMISFITSNAHLILPMCLPVCRSSTTHAPKLTMALIQARGKINNIQKQCTTTEDKLLVEIRAKVREVTYILHAQ